MLVPYDPRWPAKFDEWAAELLRSGNSSWVIEHIGSTSIPGLAAKPIIDLAVRVDDDADFEHHRAGLVKSEWHLGSGVRSHRVMVRESDGVRVAIAHFFPAATWTTVNQRLFRDWLLEYPADRYRYESVKRRAAAASASGTSSYDAAKTEFVQEIVDWARHRMGLESVPVYDK